MTRVKGGTVSKTRRRKVLKEAKGYFGSKHRLYKTAQEQVFHSGAYAYRDRKQNKRNFRKLWITRINAACRLNEISYSKFMNGLAKAGIEINRKMLSDMAINEPAQFAELVKTSKAALESKTVKAETKKVEKVEKLKELIKNHPHLKNNLTGMLQAKLEIKELKVKLSKLDRKDPANKNEIDKIQKQIKEKESKENKNKGLMIKYFTSNKIDISEKDIKELEETIVQKNGVVDINKTLDKNIKENNAIE